MVWKTKKRDFENYIISLDTDSLCGIVKWFENMPSQFRKLFPILDEMESIVLDEWSNRGPCTEGQNPYQR